MSQKRNVGFEIHAISNLMKRCADDSCSCCWQQKAELTAIQSRVVGFLHNQPERDIFQKDIEKELSIRRPTVSILLQTMEKKGLITRETVDYDARLKKVLLTEKAREQAESLKKEINRIEKQMTVGISDDDMAAFYRVIDAIRLNLEAGSGKSPKKGNISSCSKN